MRERGHHMPPAQLQQVLARERGAEWRRHKGRTRMRASVNPPQFARFEGGTSPVEQRIGALARTAAAGYPVGLTIASIIAVDGWEQAYAGLIEMVAAALEPIPDLDLTVELITHRYSPGSKAVLESCYSGSSLDMGTANRVEKRTKFGSVKHVYDPDTMRALRSFFEHEITRRLPTARILYWT